MNGLAGGRDFRAIRVEALLTPERQQDFDQLCRCLQSPTPRIRSGAVVRLGDFGPAAVAPLSQALQDLDAGVLVAAVSALAKINGAEAQALLLVALQSDHPAPRVAAAQHLAEVGGEEVLPALIEAYQRCFLGGSARRQRRWGPLVCLLGMGAVVGVCACAISGGEAVFRLTVQTLGWGGLTWLGVRRKHHDSTRVLEAVLKVAERHPRPDLRALLPEVRAVINDPLHYERCIRDASRTALARIEVLTATFTNLPLPSASSALGDETFPVPVNAASVE